MRAASRDDRALVGAVIAQPGRPSGAGVKWRKAARERHRGLHAPNKKTPALTNRDESHTRGTTLFDRSRNPLVLAYARRRHVARKRDGRRQASGSRRSTSEAPVTPPRKITGGFRLRLPAPEATRCVAASGGSGSGSGVIFGALARSGSHQPRTLCARKRRVLVPSARVLVRIAVGVTARRARRPTRRKYAIGARAMSSHVKPCQAMSSASAAR